MGFGVMQHTVRTREGISCSNEMKQVVERRDQASSLKYVRVSGSY
jgi:hypothetical protein